MSPPTKAVVIAFDHQKLHLFLNLEVHYRTIEGYIDVAQFDISIPTYAFSITDSVLQQKLCDFLDASEVKPFIENNDLDLHFLDFLLYFQRIVHIFLAAMLKVNGSLNNPAALNDGLA